MSGRQGSILVIVRQADDVELARALIEAVSGEFSCYLLFALEELRDRFGHIPCPYGLDTQACVLNPQHFGLVVSFWGARDPNPASNALLLSFFDEVGVPTLEIQHRLFQEDQLEPVGFESAPFTAAAPLPRGYAARRYLPWDGPHGVGYLKSELVREKHAFQRQDLVLVSSELDSPAYDDKQRYQFGIAIAKLAAAHPELTFVWPVRPAELAHADAKPVLGMVEEYAIANLALEKSEGMEAWVSRCRLGISSPATPLLEYQLACRPVIVHLGAEPAALTERLAGQGFRDYFELERMFRRAWEAPSEFLVEVGVERLNRERLVETLRQAMRPVELARDWLPTAWRYIAYMREGRAARVEINKLLPAMSGLERRLASVETQLNGLDQGIARLDGALGGVAKELTAQRTRLAGIADRVSQQQRFSLGHKARRIVARWRGRHDGEPSG